MTEIRERAAPPARFVHRRRGHVATKSTKDMERAQAAFHKKETQARQGAQAMSDYQAGLKAERAKTEKLRALRLAKEAADAEAAAERHNADLLAAAVRAKAAAAKLKPAKKAKSQAKSQTKSKARD